MRLGEIQNLRWESVDLTDQGEIHVSSEETKTSVARTVPLGRILDVLRIMRAKNPTDVYVFGGDRPLGDFRKRWYDACVVAGLGKFVEGRYVGRTFHDLRRSAVRSMVLARSGAASKQVRRRRDSQKWTSLTRRS
jgi:integrase